MRPARFAARARRVTRSTRVTSSASSSDGDRRRRRTPTECRSSDDAGRGARGAGPGCARPRGGGAPRGPEERAELRRVAAAERRRSWRYRERAASRPSPSPTPQSASTGSGSRNSASRSGSMTSRPSGLRGSARHLRQHLRPRDADRDRQADPLSSPAPECLRDLRRRARDPLEAADVEERLLERQALHQRRRLLEQVEERPARLRVGVEARRHRDQVGTEPARAASAHAAVDPVGPRLVARGHHHPSTDDSRPAAQSRVVSLLDRGEEGVGIGVEDRSGC